MPKLGKTNKRSVGKSEQKNSGNTTIAPQSSKTTGYVVFTEQDLRGMSQNDIDKILIIYGIDVKKRLVDDKKSRATESFKIELIMEAQLKAINETGTTPRGLIQVSGVKESNLGFTETNMSVTVNMGNYNSLKVESGLTLPVGYNKDLEELAVEQLGKQLQITKNFLKLRVEQIKEDMLPVYDKL